MMRKLGGGGGGTDNAIPFRSCGLVTVGTENKNYMYN